MPGPMSIPNGTNRLHKFVVEHEDEQGKKHKRDIWVSTQNLSGEQRAHLASRRRLETGKTARKKRNE